MDPSGLQAVDGTVCHGDQSLRRLRFLQCGHSPRYSVLEECHGLEIVVVDFMVAEQKQKLYLAK